MCKVNNPCKGARHCPSLRVRPLLTSQHGLSIKCFSNKDDKDKQKTSNEKGKAKDNLVAASTNEDDKVDLATYDSDDIL